MEVATVDFHGDQLMAIEKNGERLVPMRPLVTAMGLEWKVHHKMVMRDIVLSSTVSITETVGADGKVREMVCLPLRYLNGWLFKINAARYLDPEKRDTIIQYQKECYQVLFNHFHPAGDPDPRYNSLDQVAKDSKAITMLFKSQIQIAKSMGMGRKRAVLSANAAVERMTGHDCIKSLEAERFFDARAYPAAGEADRYDYEDVAADFVTTCCVVEPGAQVGASVLYEAYTNWCRESGFAKLILSQRRFGQIMGARFEKVKSGIVRYIDIRLKKPALIAV